ncbi:MAG: beta-L-arabinofuranosidase domain-containing protein, partial [Armatimonadota bacterium]
MPPSTSFFIIQAKSVDGFWGKYQSKLASHGLNHQFDQLVTTGRLQNFELASKTILKQSDSLLKQQGLRFNDSDVYKWLEASAYIQALYPSDQRKNQIDAVINLIESAQEESGYINTYVTNTRPEWKWKSMAHMHELYCIGHLIEAAVALHSYASDSRLLKVALK